MVPKHLQKLLLDEYHDAPFAGHFGVKKLAGRLAQYYYWVGMKSDAHKKCALLFKDKVTGRDHLYRELYWEVPLNVWEWTSKKWTKVSWGTGMH